MNHAIVTRSNALPEADGTPCLFLIRYLEFLSAIESVADNSELDLIAITVNPDIVEKIAITTNPVISGPSHAAV